MSASTFIHQGDRVHLITDGASYEYDGRIIEIRSKVTVYPEQRAAITFRGSNGSYRDWLAERLKAQPSFDAILLEAEEVSAPLLRIASLNCPPGIDDGLKNFELTLIGYSEAAQQFEGWTIATHDAGEHDLPGYEPYKRQFLPVIHARPSVGPMHEFLGREPFTEFSEIQAIDVDTFAIKLLEAQRAMRFYEHGLQGIHGVGGFGEITTVSKDGVTQRTVVEWPDEVGRAVTI